MQFGAEPDAGANRAEPMGLALEFLVCSHQFSGRSAWTFGGEQRGGFEQEPTEGTETDSILCYLLLNSEAG